MDPAQVTRMRHVKYPGPGLLRALLFLAAIAAIIASPGCLETGDALTTDFSPPTAEIPVHRETKYGYPLDPYIVVEGKIQANQNLSDILYRFNTSSQTMQEVILKSRNVFDIRKIRRGNPYLVFCTKDSLPSAEIFIYEHTPTEYYVVELKDSVRIIRREKEIMTIQKTASGVITTSLWYAMIDNQINPLLSIELSEIFAWSIDFFGLQTGDEFKAIYEERYVDSVSTGLGKIYAAWFRHAGEEFYAIPFIQDGEESYFDQEGNSLKKAFLKAPLRFSRISSGFSHSRLHPILKIRRPHYGVDYAAPVGTPVLAIGDGRVIKMGREGEAGNMVKIRHNSVYSTAYLHLSHYARGMYPGKYVKQGDVIGYVGSTGLSTGPHLDFRFYRNDAPIDPLRVKAPPVQPVREENRETFDRIRRVVMEVMKTI